jgi:uncharacterized protein (TIGR00730 family)
MDKKPVICVFCGSSPGADPAYARDAARFGALLAENRCALVFGGGSSGLMGEVSRAAFDGKAYTTAVIPDFLHKRVAPTLHATAEIVTSSMHERKARMFELADAFVALPGGVGTLEETVEMLTWAQLGLHFKPIVLLNTAQYWDKLIALLRSIIEQDFSDARILAPLITAQSPEDAMNQLLDRF